MDVENKFIEDMKLELNERKHLELSKILLSIFIRHCEKKKNFLYLSKMNRKMR